MVNGDKGFFQWRFSPIEMLGFGFSIACVAVSITIWTVFTFQTKADAADSKVEFNDKIRGVTKDVDMLRSDLANVRSGVEAIGKDVSYIRGRLEPKSEK